LNSPWRASQSSGIPVWPTPKISRARSFIGTKGLAAALIILLTAINYLGVRFGGLVQNIFTVAKVAAMLLLVIGAFCLPTGGAVANLTTPSAHIHLSGLALVAGIVAALQGAFWAYDGWNKLTYIAGEVKQPQRNIPLGLLWGMLIVTGIYILMNVTYAYVLPIDQMAQSKLVAADVAERCFAGGGRWIAAADRRLLPPSREEHDRAEGNFYAWAQMGHWPGRTAGSTASQRR